jgi:60 kDa SS-A/Ro ribonucleoprotein
MRFNLSQEKAAPVTHEGGPAVLQTPELELERAVASCLLGEPSFYESGNGILARIDHLARTVDPIKAASLAIKARNDWHLRHVPLWLCRALAFAARQRSDSLVANTLEAVIQRPDEAPEFLAMYWKDGKVPLSAQVKRGLAKAMQKFDGYQLAKWNRPNPIKLRDVLFLSHAKPRDEAQAALWRQLIDGSLQTPDTWEVALSAGADRKSSWERLLQTKKLPHMALLKNLRNMTTAGVDQELIVEGLTGGAAHSKALPFRYVAAARACPQLAADLSDAMLVSLRDAEKLTGNTLVVIDVSGSMDVTLSSQSELSRLDAAAALAVLAREVCERCRIFSFSTKLVEIQAFRGLPLVDGISTSQEHAGTNLRASLEELKQKVPSPHRLIVITDEQSQDGILDGFGQHNYLLNVSTEKPALDSAQSWSRINGFSERFIDWLRIHESMPKA